MRINPRIHNTIDSIANVYKMHPETLKKLLTPEKILENVESRVLKQSKVQEIIDYLGNPELIYDEFDPLIYNTDSQLARYYNINYRTFIKWIKPIEGLKKDDKFRRRYMPKELMLIVEHLGI